MTLKEMYAKLAERRSAFKKLSDAVGINKATDEQRSQMDVVRAEVEGLVDACLREEEQRSADAILAGKLNENAADPESPKKAAVEVRKALMNSYLRSGYSGMSGADKKAFNEMRSMNTGTPADGGYTIDTETLAQVVIPKISYGAAVAQARTLPTGKGNPLNWAVSLEGATKGVIVGEEANHGKGDTKFGQVQLGAYKISSKVILVSEELLQDSEIDMVSYISNIARTRIMRGINGYIVNGTGTGQPKGLLKQITKDIDMANEDAFTWELFVDLYHGVDPLYRQSSKAAFGMNDKTLRNMRKFKDDNGDPIYIRSLATDKPDTILGETIVIDSEFPEFDNTVKKGQIVYGDWDAFIVRRVNGMQVKRLDELYAETGQVGFLAFERFDCVLEDTSAFCQTSVLAVK